MIKLKDLLLEKKLTDADIKVGDAYHRKTHVGYMVNFVYDTSSYGGWTTIEYQFNLMISILKSSWAFWAIWAFWARSFPAQLRTLKIIYRK